ncbi:unnamed protein product [Rotaria magnacalcarata]|uniref:Uncharacterized protein n=1 Tax=Rotaria magnacalcarata TaxID=392030 RepID=A0A816XFE1_9BILA|nr:unnamed protein product [Rotaria magnacalcarata]
MTLDLNSNNIGDEGTVYLAEALKINTTLTTLALNNNRIYDQGAVRLADALRTNKTIISLVWTAGGTTAAGWIFFNMIEEMIEENRERLKFSA